MNKSEKASIGIVKILIISIILILIMGIGVMATNSNLISAKIILSNNYEMTVLTSKTKVADILEENHVILEDNEVVTPNLQEEIEPNRTITITIGEAVQIAEREDVITKEEILSSYGPITEKLITEEVAIQYETITEDKTEGSSIAKQSKVVQNGKDGLKEVTYKVKYKEDEEIEKIEVSSKVLEEPANKIIEVKAVQVASRGAQERTVAPVIATTSDEQLEIIWAIVRQEGGASYESALAVVSSAVNRIHSSRWSRNGSTIYAQLTAKGQYCYSIDNYWRRYLNGNVPDTVKQAVTDGMNGKTNHPYTSFRGYYVEGGVNIGGNYYFGS